MLCWSAFPFALLRPGSGILQGHTVVVMGSPPLATKVADGTVKFCVTITVAFVGPLVSSGLPITVNVPVKVVVPVASVLHCAPAPTRIREEIMECHSHVPIVRA